MYPGHQQEIPGVFSGGTNHRLHLQIKTNRHKLPLLDIVGQTNTNSIFYIGFGLLAAEDEVHYSRAIRSMRTLLGEMLASREDRGGCGFRAIAK